MSQSKGIAGILDRIVSADDLRPPGKSQYAPSFHPIAQPSDGDNVARTALQGPSRAKRGRPFGKSHASEAREMRAKVTLWIGQALIDQYRDWSWEARCSLSELVQRAMAEYEKRSRQSPAA